MTYYRDLTEYEYHGASYRPGTKNIGWLGMANAFDTAEPTNELLARLWGFCKISVAQTRGMHDCEFCPGQDSYFVERNGEHLLLGSAEIRVLSETDRIYAAPTLIYHYVATHKYKPPNEFMKALFDGQSPLGKQYFDLLAKLNLEWRNTSAPDTKPVRFALKPSDR